MTAAQPYFGPGQILLLHHRITRTFKLGPASSFSPFRVYPRRSTARRQRGVEEYLVFVRAALGAIYRTSIQRRAPPQNVRSTRRAFRFLPFGPCVHRIELLASCSPRCVQNQLLRRLAASMQKSATRSRSCSWRREKLVGTQAEQDPTAVDCS